MSIKEQKVIMTIVTIALFLFLIPVGCGGGSSSTETPDKTPTTDNSLPENNRITDTEALDNAPLTSGGAATLKSDDSAVGDASLFIPPDAVDQNEKSTKVTITATSTLPQGSPWGQVPIGSLFKIEPSGLEFDPENRAVLTLPIPPGGPEENLYMGRWNEANSTWENIGGTIEGDFLSAEVDHLSLYGIFSEGKSLVRIINSVTSAEDPGDKGIEVHYISGPLPYPDWPDDRALIVERPLPKESFNLKAGKSRLMMLSPGQYNFTVSYLSPSLVTNSLSLRIPAPEDSSTVVGNENRDANIVEIDLVFKGVSKNLNIAGGVDVDQTMTITASGASSDNTYTNSSLVDFPGKREVISSNEPPTLKCSASSQQDVVITNRDPGAIDLPSRRIAVGPILNKRSDSSIKFTGTAIDPEDGFINYYWTLSGRGTLPLEEVEVSGREIKFNYVTKSKREGTYHVYLTAYDESNLFDECHWEITVRGNEKPMIKVVSDFKIIDYGRFGDIFTLGDRNPLGELADGESWCDYVGGTNLVRLKSLEIEGDSNDHINRPTQYPAGMTCLFAMIGDADSDPLTFAYKFPFTGSYYSALDGSKITTAGQLEAYNAQLTSTMSDFPIPAPLEQFAPEGVKFALPIVWEAPDNIGILASDDSSPTHDCRHYENVTNDLEPCLDWGRFPDGGAIAISAMVTDSYSRAQTDYDWVGYGLQPIIKLDEGGNGSDINQPPTCSNDSVTTDMNQPVTVTFSGNDPDGDKLTYDITREPSKGSMSGSVYTPSAGYSGYDSVSFVVNDGQENSSNCRVDITINSIPTKLVLDEVIFEKGIYNKDLCGESPNCIEFYDRLSDGYTDQRAKTILREGSSNYELDVNDTRTGKIISEYRVTFTFDSPPINIIEGTTISMEAKGTASGFTGGGYFSKSFKYFYKKADWKNEIDINEGAVWLNNRIHLPYDEDQGIFKGTATTKSIESKILIPEDAGDGFTIGGYANDGLYIKWVYKVAN